MTYAVKEIFLTLQGEGAQAGRRAVFLRFAGCNLWTGREQGVAQMLGRLVPEEADNQEATKRSALTGLYHCSCSGRTSWYDYAKTAIELARRNDVKLKLQPHNLIPIPSAEYPTPAARPANPVLDNTKLEKTFGIQRPDWQSDVETDIQDLCR